jgi:uncharacterized protein
LARRFLGIDGRIGGDRPAGPPPDPAEANLAYQGGLTVLAALLDQVMTPPVVAAMTGVGGLLVIAIGLRLLGLARVRVANLLPAVLLAPLATAVVAATR